MVAVICEDAAALAPAGHRRLVFAHHAEQQLELAVKAAQARVAQLAASGGLAPGAGGLGGGA